MVYKKPGVSMLGSGARYGTDGTAEWNEALDAKMRAGMSKAEAVRALVRERPDLHVAYVKEHNQQVGPSTFRGSTL